MKPWPVFRAVNSRRDVKEILKDYFNRYLTQDMDVYDIGCGSKPYADILKGKVKNHIGVDIEDGFYDVSHIDLIGSAYDVPVEDSVADAVISSQVLEHLERPADAIKEAVRILKKDGLLFLSFPFLYPMHAVPHDYSRITEFNIKKMLAHEGVEIIEMKRICGFWYVVGMFVKIYLRPIDRGLLKRTGISAALLWFICWIFHLLHLSEGLVLKVLNKDPETVRKKWTISYIIAARIRKSGAK